MQTALRRDELHTGAALVSPQPAESDGALDAGAKLFAAAASREEGRIDALDVGAAVLR
jgi:hypothetical protein